MHLDPAFADERVHLVIEAASAHEKLLGYLSLGHVGIVLQHAQEGRYKKFKLYTFCLCYTKY